MRFLIVTPDYDEFLHWFHRRAPHLKDASFEEQQQARWNTMFLWADFYSYHLRALGHEAWDVIYNDPYMQGAWAREHGLKVGTLPEWRLRLRRGLVPWLSRTEPPNWKEQILLAQIRHYRPDVLFLRDVNPYAVEFLRELKQHTRLIFAQHAAHLKKDRDYSCLDLFLSSLPNFVEHVRKLGGKGQLFRLGFEHRVLDHLRNGPRTIDASFIGTISQYPRSRDELIRGLCNTLDISIYGSIIPPTIDPESPLGRSYRGPAWGVEMFQYLRDSRTTLNAHVSEWAENYANNMRMYEATGVGTLLVTDWKPNLHEMFSPDSEVVTYKSPEECAEKVRYYLEHEREREAIAAAGQRRTLRDHTYFHRMQELEQIAKSLA
jgi:spore maturation protein CgeB